MNSKKLEKKYNLSVTFNDNIEAMSKEEYENLIKSLIETIEDFFNIYLYQGEDEV